MHKLRFFLSEIPDSLDESKQYELIHTGRNTDPRYGDFRFSRTDLEEMASNFNNDVRGIEIAVDINHDPQKKAYAWIRPGSMSVQESTKMPGEYALFAQLYRFTPEGEELVRTGAFRYFSLQIKHDYEYFADTMKKIAKNVIVGLALTNSPVIKGLAPTYAEQHTSTIYSLSMEMFQAFLDYLSAKETVSAEEKQTLQKMLGMLSTDEQASVKDAVDGVMQLPEQAEMATKPDAATPPPAEGEGSDGAVEVEVEAGEKKQPPVTQCATCQANAAKGKSMSEEGEKKEEEEKPEASAEGETSKEGEQPKEDKALSEMQAQVKSLAEERDQLLAEKREKHLGEVIDGLLLSESNKTGFVAEQRDELKAFVSTLSEEGAQQFCKLVGKIRSVDLSERGNSGKGEHVDVKQLAEQIARDQNIPMSSALERAYKQIGVWGKLD